MSGEIDATRIGLRVSQFRRRRMRFSIVVFNVISFIAFSVIAEREEAFATARIFLHKSTVSQFPLIVGSDLIIKYVVSNNGEAPATSLVMTDRYDPASFALIENVNVNGSVLFSLDELAPGALVRTRSAAVHFFLNGIRIIALQNSSFIR